MSIEKYLNGPAPFEFDIQNEIVVEYVIDEKKAKKADKLYEKFMIAMDKFNAVGGFWATTDGQIENIKLKKEQEISIREYHEKKLQKALKRNYGQ